MFKDYYRTLGIRPSATQTEIKTAFRALAKRYHPDANPGDKSAERIMSEINEAYETLSNDGKRWKYDNENYEYLNGSGFGAAKKPQADFESAFRKHSEAAYSRAYASGAASTAWRPDNPYYKSPYDFKPEDVYAPPVADELYDDDNTLNDKKNRFMGYVYIWLMFGNIAAGMTAFLLYKTQPTYWLFILTGLCLLGLINAPMLRGSEGGARKATLYMLICVVIGGIFGNFGYITFAASALTFALMGLYARKTGAELITPQSTLWCFIFCAALSAPAFFLPGMGAREFCISLVWGIVQLGVCSLDSKFIKNHYYSPPGTGAKAYAGGAGGALHIVFAPFRYTYKLLEKMGGRRYRRW